MSVLNKILASSGDDIAARAANYADDAARSIQNIDDFIASRNAGKKLVYHRTNATPQELAKGFRSRENTGEAFVSSLLDSPNTSGYGKNVIPLYVDEPKLRLDDVFPSGEEHFALKSSDFDDALAKYLADVDEYNAISGIVDNSVRNVDRGLVDDFMSSLDPYDVQRGNIKLKRFAPLDYQTGHTPDISGLLLSNITDDNLGYVGDDFFEHPHYYNATPEQADIVRRFDGNPEELVTIYRATDAGDQINPYDWVTLQEEYAREHLMNNLGGKGKVLKQQVPARDVRFAGDDFAEFGYFPTYIE